MKKIRIITVILCVSLICGIAPVSSAASADGAKNQIPYADTRDAATSPYWYKTMNIYTEEEAASAGVPEGYGGYVMKLAGDTAAGITVDFSGRSIPVTSVKALHMRVYYGENTKEVRVTTDAGVSWVLRHNAEKPGEWEDVVIKDTNSIKQLADTNGRLGKFGFGFRYLDNGSDNNVAYIDEIRAELNVSDDIPPVIKYEGPDHIETTEGKPFVIDASARDEQENASFPLEFIWDKPATDENGTLLKGEYVLTLRAKDSLGNTAEKILTVSVGEKDTTAPVIECDFDNIKTVAGAYDKLDFKAKDDKDEVIAIKTWSDKAIDKQGRITAGTHTLTLTATDLTGNTTTVTIKVTASKTLD